MEGQVKRADDRIFDMSRAVSKLHHFKKSVLASIGQDDVPNALTQVCLNSFDVMSTIGLYS